MHTTGIIYEQPLNERLRFFLRLEFLFRQARHHLRGEGPWASHATLAALLDIVSIISRLDLKTEVIKELERVNTALAALSNTPHINSDMLQQILTTTNGLKSQLYTQTGPLAQDIRDNEFLKALLQKSGVPGNLCDFDQPAFRYWLRRPDQQRTDDLKSWLGTLDGLRHSIELILKLVRESVEPAPKTAPGGVYQQSLDPGIPFQLLRVTLPEDSMCFAEISAGKHRFTVRFMERTSLAARPTQTEREIAFQIACCVL